MRACPDRRRPGHTCLMETGAVAECGASTDAYSPTLCFVQEPPACTGLRAAHAGAARAVAMRTPQPAASIAAAAGSGGGGGRSGAAASAAASGLQSLPGDADASTPRAVERPAAGSGRGERQTESGDADVASKGQPRPLSWLQAAAARARPPSGQQDGRGLAGAGSPEPATSAAGGSGARFPRRIAEASAGKVEDQSECSSAPDPVPRAPMRRTPLQGRAAPPAVSSECLLAAARELDAALLSARQARPLHMSSQGGVLGERMVLEVTRRAW